MNPRSYLYVPGDRPERFPKALRSGTDAVVFDLEDAVVPTAKDDARSRVVGALEAAVRPEAEMWVRINSGRRGRDDLRAINGAANLAGVFVPKATTSCLAEIRALAGEVRVCALVEGALGVLQVADLAASDIVDRLAMGEVDLAADLAMLTSPRGAEFWPVRLQVVVASAAYECAPPIGPVWTDIGDADGLRSSTAALRRAGFGARQAIHPSQVAVINEAMSPATKELERAAHVLAMAEQAGGGAFVDDDGRMVDEAVLRTARRLLGPSSSRKDDLDRLPTNDSPAADRLTGQGDLRSGFRTGAPDTSCPPPLAGLKILDLSTYVAGPSGTMALAQLGADVIRVDPIGGATDTRRLPLDKNGDSLYWAGLNRGKRSIEIDTRKPEGQALVHRLLAASGPEGGILLTNSVDRHWLAYEELVVHREDLIEVHIAGRPDGKPAVDYTVNCEVGLPLITGPTDVDRPVNHVLPAWDLLTGLEAALGILAAERVRARTGKGQLVTVSLADVAVAAMGHLGFIGDVVINGRDRLRYGNYLYGSFGCDFRTRDGRRVMIVALTERQWRGLVEVTGSTEVIEVLERTIGVDLTAEESRFQHRELLVALLRTWFESRDFAEVAAALERSRVLWGPYRTMVELVSEPDSLLNLSPVYRVVDHPNVGAYPAPGPVLGFSQWSWPPVPVPPGVGDDTDAVLGGFLGLGRDQLDDLRKHQVIGGRPGA